MKDSFSSDGTGRARFSDDDVMRYRLARACSSLGWQILDGYRTSQTKHQANMGGYPVWSMLSRVVFVMLNPSTADAFDLDPTVRECIRFAKLWRPNLDLVEVVNLFAFRSPYPAVLKRAGERGNDAGNDAEILQACTGASLVIRAWGTGGRLDDRDVNVSRMLSIHDIATHHIGITKDGHPKHPLARGKNRIPSDQQPIPWAS